MCRQEARQGARTSSGQAKCTVIFNGKCVQRKSQWNLVMLARFNVEKLNNENRKSILHPPLHGVTANKICYSTRKAILLVIFSISRLGQCPGTCKKRFFDCCNLDKRLARTWYNPSNELKGESVAEPCWRKRQNWRNWPGESLEPSGT